MDDMLDNFVEESAPRNKKVTRQVAPPIPAAIPKSSPHRNQKHRLQLLRLSEYRSTNWLRCRLQMVSGKLAHSQRCKLSSSHRCQLTYPPKSSARLQPWSFSRSSSATSQPSGSWLRKGVGLPEETRRQSAARTWDYEQSSLIINLYKYCHFCINKL